MPKRKRTFSAGGARKRLKSLRVVPANRRPASAAQATYGTYGGTRELKFKDDIRTLTQTAIGVVPQDNAITIALGNAESDRIGRKCVLKSIYFETYFKLFAITGTVASGAPSAANIVRFVVVQDRQCNGGGISWNSVFNDTNLLALKRMENEMRYKIIYDEKIMLIPPGIGLASSTSDVLSTVTPNVERARNFMLRLNLPIEYDGSSGDVTTRRSNSLSYMMYFDRTHPVLWHVRTRVRYLD